ncbi:MAG: TolC family protein [Clostridia bacterium]|nr:TolC family protein [Clostridia bacterium]
MLKKSILLFLCLTMMSMYVFASDSVTTNSDTSINFGDVTIYTLTLDDAINIALNDNPQLNASIVKKQNNKAQLQSARDTKAGYGDIKEINISAGYELNYIKNSYYIHLYQNAVKLSDYEYKQIEAQISYNITEKYFNLKNAEKLVEISKNSYQLVKENYDASLLSYELGLIAKTDLDNVMVGLMQAEFALNNYTNNYEIAKEDFKIALRKNNENCDFVLTSSIDVIEYETNLENDLVNAENSRYDIMSLKSNYELSKEYFQLTNLPENTARYTSAYNNYITAEYNYTNNKALILLGVKSGYNNIYSTRNSVTLAEMTLNLKKNAYEIAKVKFEHGMITNTELLSALNDVYLAEVEYENSKLKYILAVDKYKYDISIGL